MNDKFKTISIDAMIDKYIGERGTSKREVFENELRLELLEQSIDIELNDKNFIC